MNIQEIKNKLKLLGASGKDIDMAIRDVNEIIAERAISFYLSKLSDEQKEKLAALSKEDVLIYFEANKDQLHQFSKDEFEKLSQGVWDEYFLKMKK